MKLPAYLVNAVSTLRVKVNGSILQLSKLFIGQNFINEVLVWKTVDQKVRSQENIHLVSRSLNLDTRQRIGVALHCERWIQDRDFPLKH